MPPAVPRTGGAQQGARDKKCTSPESLKPPDAQIQPVCSLTLSFPSHKAKRSSDAASLRAAQKHQLETPESALREHWMLKQACLLFLLRISMRKEINICLGFFEAKKMEL